MSNTWTYEPPPKGQQVVVRLVMDDLARSRFGEEKYGTPLMTNNGRDALWDAYQEALGLVCYLKQELLRREDHGPKTAPEALRAKEQARQRGCYNCDDHAPSCRGCEDDKEGQ